MRRSGTALLVAGVVAALGAAGTVFAYAGGWVLADNPATFTAKVARMPRGVEPSVAKQSGRAVVTWSAQEIAPGTPMDHYVVTAYRKGPPAKPDLTRTVAATTGNAAESVFFAGDDLAGGDWTWTVTPRFRLWTGTESRRSRSLTFPAAPADRPVSPSVPASPAAEKPSASSSTPVTRSSPSPARTTDAPEKQPAEPRPQPTRSPTPTSAPAPVESGSSEPDPPPAAQ